MFEDPVHTRGSAGDCACYQMSSLSRCYQRGDHSPDFSTGFLICPGAHSLQVTELGSPQNSVTCKLKLFPPKIHSGDVQSEGGAPRWSVCTALTDPLELQPRFKVGSVGRDSQNFSQNGSGRHGELFDARSPNP